MVIDRGGLTCASRTALPLAINEVARVLKKNGYFMFNPYSDVHSSYVSGDKLADGTVINIQRGTLVNVGQISFVSRSDIDDLLSNDCWKIESVFRKEIVDMLGHELNIHAEWQVIAQRI